MVLLDYEVSIKGLLEMLRRRIVLLIVIPLVFIVVAYAVIICSSENVYQSIAKVFPERSADSEFGVAPRISLYASVLGAEEAAATAVKQLSFNISVEGFLKMTTVSYEDDLLIIEATSPDPALAQEAAAALAKVAPEVLISNLLTDKVVTIEKASLPTAPVNPFSKKRLVVIGLFGGVLALGLAFYLEFFHGKIRSHTMIEQMGVDFLASIPIEEGAQAPSVVVTDPNSKATSAYYQLAVRLRAVAQANGIKSLVVTDPVVAQTPPTVAINLAVALALSGSKVLLVDGNLRNPSLDVAFTQEQTVTLSALLKERPPGPALLPSSVDNLTVLQGGDIQNPLAVLSSQSLYKLVKDFERDYDWVIIATSAVSENNDAIIWATLAQSALLSVQWNTVSINKALRALGQLKTAKVKLVGAVFNNVKG